MKIVNQPQEKEWASLMQRPEADFRDIEAAVREIIQDVRRNGNEALLRYNAALDGYRGKNLRVEADEFEKAEIALSPDLKSAILLAAKNIEKFHQTLLPKSQKTEVQEGIVCWKKALPIDDVGLYIPGGTAPLFSTVLMLGIPARLAGCKNVFLCTPPSSDGKVHPAIIFAAKVAGITNVFLCGGAQAIAAMAFGNTQVPKADKIFGPGNRYVTMAKSLVASYGIAIDMPAGPSEVLVIADESANANFVASDLLSQAEHGVDSQVICLCLSENKAQAIAGAVEELLAKLPRKEIAEKALQKSAVIVLQSMEEAMRFSNQYAPEHLILACDDAEQWAEQVRHAGSVFLGHYSPESAGDYASGTNHTLPTNGFAKAYSGVSTESFMKNISFQQLSQKGLTDLSQTVIQMAEAEGLHAHALAVKVRMNDEI
ncbi:MAG: histidinol dehydrogenase [Flavobacteriales bacterium]